MMVVVIMARPSPMTKSIKHYPHFGVNLKRLTYHSGHICTIALEELLPWYPSV